MHEDHFEHLHKEQKTALLIALYHGATISRSRTVKDAPFTIAVKGERGIVPAGLVHELTQERILKKQDYPHQFFYTLTANGAETAKNTFLRDAS